MAELTFDGQDIRQAAARTSRSGIFFDLVSGYFEPADVRGSDTVIPAADGRVVRNRVVDARTIVLKGYVVGTSASDWRTKTQTLFGVMDPTTTANLVISDAYLGTTGSPTIACRFVNAVGATPTNGPTFQEWTIELQSVVPDWS